VFDGKGGQAPTPNVVRVEPQPDSNAEAQAVAATAPTPPPPASAERRAVPQSAQARPEQGTGSELTQEQQLEAIRRRIEARRAQMRAEAAAGSKEK
ncbi:MAG: hypothetical protein H7147_11705, partial [Frankiaceae bacterium]|nr:hypothetical protein [Arenimonas sp.]